MRSGFVLWKTLLVLGGALVVVSGRDQVFGQDGTWIAKAPIPTPRGGLAVGVVNGILYAVGGRVDHEDGRWEYLPTVEAYDPSTNSWTRKAPMPTPARLPQRWGRGWNPLCFGRLWQPRPRLNTIGRL